MARRTGRAPRRRMARRSAPSRPPRRARRSAGTISPSWCRSRSSKAWRMIGSAGRSSVSPGSSATNARRAEQRELFVEGKPVALPEAYAQASAKLRERFASERPKLATRQASQQVLDGIAGTIPGSARRLGGPDAFEPHACQGADAGHARRVRRRLHPLRHPRARHGRRDERPRAAWRLHSLWRHLPRLLRLQPAGDPPCGLDAACASSM